MSSPVKTVQENETLQHACKIMNANNIGGIIVQAKDKPPTPIGIITERDIVRHLAEKPISFEAPASQIMSKPLVTIRSNGSLRDALQTMQARDIRRIVVVSDDGKAMIGIVTDKDIFRFIAKNETVSSAFVREEVLTKDRDMAERLNTNLLGDILHRRL